jgi:hypothetical protein
MNVFVLCTGRCGSMTFVKACGHMTNFTAGHETRARRIGPERLDYPDGHIEADNRLSWLLGRLDAKYGDSARYVHLRRDPEAVARSIRAIWPWRGSIARGYRDAIHMNFDADELEVSRDYVRTVTANIEHFLKDKTYTMTLWLEEASRDFPVFWQWIGAEGDLDGAMAEWSVRHNAADEIKAKAEADTARRKPSLGGRIRDRLANASGKRPEKA